MILSNDYADIIVDFKITEQRPYETPTDICYHNVEGDLGIVYAKRSELPPITLSSLSYSFLPKCYGLMQMDEVTGGVQEFDTTSLIEAGILQSQGQPLELTGRRVTIGFIDTGIRYENEVFRTSGGQSRITAIWDQTIQSGEPPAGFEYGTEYTREQIDEALASDNPLQIVPSTDTIGHGTAIASVAAGSRLSDNRRFVGAAPDCNIVVVKLKPIKQYLREYYLIPQDVPCYQETDLIQAIQYLQKFAVSLYSPLVICLGVGTNLGDHAGVSVSVVEMGNQVMAPIDFSMAAPVHQHLVQKGVSLYLEEGVTHFQRTEQGITVFLKSGKTIPADMVLLSIGVRPATALAKDAGLKIGEAGGIWVNEYLETSEKDIYAVGDAIEYPHPLTGKPWLNYLANPANRQGRIVADNMVFGNKVSYEGAIGTSIAKVFDMTVASTGLAAKRLKQWEMVYQSSVTHSASHAGYYPDALPLTLKLTFHPVTGKLYGAQCIGYEGVDKRIDQIAGLIKRGGTVYDLMETEHTYAPPFSSAKDPIAIAGYVASNIISGAMPIITWRELVQQKNEVMLIDTRTPEEFSFGSIPGINIPLDDLRDRMSEVPASKPVVLFCAVGLRGYLAQRILMGNGYRNVRNLSGGYKLYSAAVAPVPVPDKVAIPQVNSIESTVSSSKEPLKINACGLQCPGPIMQVKRSLYSNYRER